MLREYQKKDFERDWVKIGRPWNEDDRKRVDELTLYNKNIRQQAEQEKLQRRVPG